MRRNVSRSGITAGQPAKNVVSSRTRNVRHGLMRLRCRGDGRESCTVKRHRNVYTRGGSGSRNPFSCTVTRTRLSRVLEDWFSSGAFVILSSTSSSQNFLVPRTPAREKDKEDTVGCVFTSVPRFSCGSSACRTTYIRIF